MNVIENKSNRRDFLKCMGVLGVASLTGYATAQATESVSTTKPLNVLFIFADDQRADTIGALGNDVIKTPNLDKLVHNGVSFVNNYCMGSSSRAVCVPSRNMMFSGQHGLHKSMFGSKKPKKLPDLPMFPRWMKNQGYATMHTGKWVNQPVACTDEFEINLRVHHGKDTCVVNVNNVINFLEKKEEKKDERPFFVYMALSRPHWPFANIPEYTKLYSPDDIKLNPSFQEMPTYSRGTGKKISEMWNIMYPIDDRSLPLPRTAETMRKYLAGYYADISYIDAEVGRLINKIEEMGLKENTIIIYSSDHGWSLGDHGIMSKSNCYEQSYKAPLIFSGPGIPKGKISKALTYIHDIFPTVCDLAKVEKPKKIQSSSLAPVISGKKEKVRDTLFTWFSECERAVRDDRWKLIQYPQTNVTQLYDLIEDPYETVNYAYDAKYADKVTEMMGKLKVWQKELNDKLPLTCDDPENPVFVLAEQQEDLKDWNDMRKEVDKLKGPNKKEKMHKIHAKMLLKQKERLAKYLKKLKK